MELECGRVCKEADSNRTAAAENEQLQERLQQEVASLSDELGKTKDEFDYCSS